MQMEPIFKEGSPGWLESLSPNEREAHKTLTRYNRSRNSKVSRNMVWPVLVKLEPRLMDIEQYLASVEDDGSEPSFCANSIWYGHGIRERTRRRRET